MRLAIPRLAADCAITLQLECEQFGFGHFLNGVAQALTAKSGIFDSAVGHLVGTESGNVIGDHAGDFKLLECAEDQLHVIAEKLRPGARNGVSLTRTRASSNVRYGSTVLTGAKTSMQFTFIFGLVFVRTVGSRNQPRRLSSALMPA